MPWLQLQIPADPDTADQLEDLLLEMGADAVTMEDAADDPIFEPDPGTTPLWGETRVTGLFDASRNGEELCSAIRSAWHQQTQQDLPGIEIVLVEDKDWERAWMDEFIGAGYVDTFRHFCAEPDQYTWWSYRFHAREKNIGWRIDYTCVNPAFLPRVRESVILKDVYGSGHCPVRISYED